MVASKKFGEALYKRVAFQQLGKAQTPFQHYYRGDLLSANQTLRKPWLPGPLPVQAPRYFRTNSVQVRSQTYQWVY